MVFESFTEAQWSLFWIVFGIAFIMGAVVNKTNFCTMGAVSDWVNMGDTGRFRSWVLALSVAIVGVLALEGTGMLDLSSTFPGYRSSTFFWFQHLLGGILFGIGMTLGSGCANKNLVRLGGGNIKSLFVVIIMGIVAYFMIFPLPGSDKSLQALLFNPWTQAVRGPEAGGGFGSPLTASLPASQDLGSLVSADNALQARLWIGGTLAAVLLLIVFKSADFRRSFDNILGGLVIGLGVVAGWYISGTLLVQNPDPMFAFDGRETISLPEFATGAWQSQLIAAPEGAVAPIRTTFLGTQSFTFVNPTAQAAGFVGQGLNMAFFTFGLAAFAGVIAGSFIWALLGRSFRFEWFASAGDFGKHMLGAILMGVGGVLALGCTIGQGVTGISTLAVGSFLTFLSIVFGAAMTMKMQYYKMLYEEASFLDVLLTALVDIRLLPKGLRRLEAL